MKEGYSDEFKHSCLALALVVVLLSPNFVKLLSDYLPLGDSQIGPLACYAAFLAFVYALGVTLDAIVPHIAKEWLLYPTVKGHSILRPGCTIFSKISSGDLRDHRIDLREAQARYFKQIEQIQSCDNASERANLENVAWYKLYRKYSATPSVKSGNLGYLYCRDVAALSVAVAAIAALVDVLTEIFLGEILVSVWAVLCCVVVAVACAIAARTKARRLVQTVIACDLANENSDTEEE